MGGSRRIAVLVAGVLVLAACGADGPRSSPTDTTDDVSRPLANGRQRTETFLEPTPQTGDLFDLDSPSRVEPDSTTSATAPSTTETPTTTIDDPSTTTEADGTAAGGSTSGAPDGDDAFPATTKALTRFTAGPNAADAVSLTVMRGGEVIVQSAVGQTQDESELQTGSPIVVAGLSKLVTALAVARLAQQGLVDTAAPVPWAAMGIATHRKWEPVTVAQLIDQTSGMPAKNNLWKTSTDDCAANAAELAKVKPVAKRQGKRTDANGNSCVLGLLIEHLTGESLEMAVQRLVFDPAEVDGFHVVADGLLATDGGVIEDRQLLSTGGAGTFVVSTDGLAKVFTVLTDADRAIFTDSAVMKDQYGWGHTGIAKGVSSCLWILEDGNTVVAAAAAGGNVKGGVTCDRFVPAIATDLDLGLGSAKPERSK